MCFSYISLLKLISATKVFTLFTCFVIQTPGAFK
jgi:hypothetical protein